MSQAKKQQEQIVNAAIKHYDKIEKKINRARKEVYFLLFGLGLKAVQKIHQKFSPPKQEIIENNEKNENIEKNENNENIESIEHIENTKENKNLFSEY